MYTQKHKSYAPGSVSTDNFWGFWTQWWAYFSSGGHIFSYLGPTRLEQQLILRSIHTDVGWLRGELPYPLVVNIYAFQESIEVVDVLSRFMMIVVMQPSCTSYVTAGALRILDISQKNTNNGRKKKTKWNKEKKRQTEMLPGHTALWSRITKNAAHSLYWWIILFLSWA